MLLDWDFFQPLVPKEWFTMQADGGNERNGVTSYADTGNSRNVFLTRHCPIFLPLHKSQPGASPNPVGSVTTS